MRINHRSTPSQPKLGKSVFPNQNSSGHTLRLKIQSKRCGEIEEGRVLQTYKDYHIGKTWNKRAGKRKNEIVFERRVSRVFLNLIHIRLES